VPHKHRYKLITKTEFPVAELIFLKCECGDEIMNSKGNLKSPLTTQSLAKYFWFGWIASSFKSHN
jgi:hypothetical protein